MATARASVMQLAISQMLHEYPVRDSGTFWYHPYQSSFEQVPRGLCGAYIVEETRPIEIDREVVWVLSGVTLGAEGQPVEDFGRVLDLVIDCLPAAGAGELARTAEMMEKYGLAWTMNYTAQHGHFFRVLVIKGQT